MQGHRGAKAARPENTLSAFRYGIDAGVDTLELDTGVTHVCDAGVIHGRHRREVSLEPRSPFSVRSFRVEDLHCDRSLGRLSGVGEICRSISALAQDIHDDFSRRFASSLITLRTLAEMTDDYVTYLSELPAEPSLDFLLAAAGRVCQILGLPEPELSFSETNVPVWRLPVDILQNFRNED